MSKVSDFLREAQVSYQEIENIVLVVGPGSFTGIRTTVLYANTLSFIFPHLFLTGVSFFDLYETYPIVKTSSKRDLFVQKEK
jgi:tRNA A37 threonylcarbamoyladenosine modification protein TsaB